MRIIDPVRNRIGLGSDRNKDTIGIVVKTQEENEGKPILGLYIPKLMLGYDLGNKIEFNEADISIKGSKCINENKSFWKGSVTIKNYIQVRPYLNQNQSMPVYTKGDKVLVTLVDNDIKTLAFLPYSINRLGQRATDILQMSIPANPNENIALDEDNTYFLKLDSKAKVIILATSKKNGEACAQTIGMDAENGQIVITDNEDRSWILDTQNDSVTTKTSGSTVEQSADVINLTSDTTNIKAETKCTIETDTLEITADTIKSKASDTTYEYDNFQQTSDVGKFEIDIEKHSGTTMSVQASTYHNDTPMIGLNGTVIFPAFQVGAVPDINVPVNPVNGISGPEGSMMMQTDPSGVPLVKFPQLMTCLSQIAAAADMYPSGAGMASAAVASFSSGGASTKIMAS